MLAYFGWIRIRHFVKNVPVLRTNIQGVTRIKTLHVLKIGYVTWYVSLKTSERIKYYVEYVYVLRYVVELYFSSGSLSFHTIPGG